MSHVHPIEEQVARFLAEKHPGRGDVLSPATLSSYQMTVQRIFLPWVLARGITDGLDVTVAVWNAYVDELRSRDLAIQSVLTYLRGARIFLGALGVPCLGKVGRKLYREPKADKPMLEIPTPEEIDLFEALAQTERDKLIVRVLANTGIRLGELTGLKPKDLHETTSPMRYCRIRVWGKGSKEREVPIDKDTYRRLEAFGKSGGKRTYIFPAMQHDRRAGTLVMLDGPRLSNNAVDKMFRELKKAARISEERKFTPHTLRHAFATDFLSRGGSIQQLQLILGHSDLTMIIKVYQHLTPNDASREYERVFGNVSAMIRQLEEPKKRRRIA